ncbi:HepT-like ribonuclease domain-containing protein [Herbiconiux aconitum]|uniref:HepT-like ribonuclease domain-containing protein n=1 Tax=Herbiconiux aconitum TaxID=2970913 RepID=UPI0035577391
MFARAFWPKRSRCEPQRSAAARRDLHGLRGRHRLREPDVPWKDISRMRDPLAHHYFDTSPELRRPETPLRAR